MKDLKIGITGNAVVHSDQDNFGVEERFRMVKEAGVFDYYDKTPPPGEFDSYLSASAKHGIPIRAGGFFYTKGRDEALLQWHLVQAKELGSLVHNVQLKTHDAAGTPLSNSDVAEFYLLACETGERTGVVPCFEVHVNMWSEHLGRVAQVAELVERRGVKFNLTLDHSHVIFKIDNPKEQLVQGMHDDVLSGKLVLDPRLPGNVSSQWIHANHVRHAHARPVVPNNPVNIWARYPNGSFGRGIQYPFQRPAPGAWHAEWHEQELEPWKDVIRQLLSYHAQHQESCLGQISLEIIPNTDYGAGAKYSLFEDSIACAKWIRETWTRLSLLPAPESP